MNYFESKKQVIMAMFITLSVISSTSHGANGEYFPAGEQIFLDATRCSDWYDTSKYPNVYMFNNNSKCWVTMRRYKIDENDKYFGFTVPDNSQYSTLIFTLQNIYNEQNTYNDQTDDWTKCIAQTNDISYENIKNCNCYIFDNTDNKKQITGHWEYIDLANKKYSIIGKRIFLNAVNISDWNNPWMYVWNNSNESVNTWIKMEQYTIDSDNKYLYGIIPTGWYNRLIFTSQKCDNSGWDKYDRQTINTVLDNNSNCYTLTNEYNDNKIVGYWSFIVLKNETENQKSEITENDKLGAIQQLLNENNKLELVQQLLNECATLLNNTSGNITVISDYNTFKINNETVTNFSDGTNTYNLACADNKITITKNGNSDAIFTIDILEDNSIVMKNISGIKANIEKNKENEIKDLVINSFYTNYPTLFSNNKLTGKTTIDIVNNGLQLIKNNLNCLRNDNILSVLNAQIESKGYIKLPLKCKGIAKWDWETCMVTFTYTVNNKDINFEDENTITREYNEGDITEQNILTELLRKRILFYTKDNKKYVFNSVDLSGIKYYIYPSKYVFESKNYCNHYYCLKCALNNIKYNTFNGWYDYNNNKEITDNKWLGDCNQPGHGEINCYDTGEDNYQQQQLQILDNKAGGTYKNRILYIRDYNYKDYTHDKFQELCTLDDLKNEWDDTTHDDL